MTMTRFSFLFELFLPDFKKILYATFDTGVCTVDDLLELGTHSLPKNSPSNQPRITPDT